MGIPFSPFEHLYCTIFPLQSKGGWKRFYEFFLASRAFFRRSAAALFCSSVNTRLRLGFLPRRNGHKGQSFAGHSFTSSLWSQQQSRHFARIAFIGDVMLTSAVFFIFIFSLCHIIPHCWRNVKCAAQMFHIVRCSISSDISNHCLVKVVPHLAALLVIGGL